MHGLQARSPDTCSDTAFLPGRGRPRRSEPFVDDGAGDCGLVADDPLVVPGGPVRRRARGGVLVAALDVSRSAAPPWSPPCHRVGSGGAVVKRS
jgi:hypothetical protein